MTYEIVCVCGQLVRGERQSRHQLVACSGCTRPLLVFPHSPYAPVAPTPAAPAAAGWRIPLFVGAAGIGLLALIGAAVLPLLARRAPPEDAAAGARPVRERMAAGRQALTAGKYHLAARQLEEALRRSGAHSGLLTAAERRQLAQWHRQADLLAHLALVTLEEIVAQGKLVRDPAEWEALFALHHRGRGVLFDDRIRRDTAGRPALAHHVIAVGDETVRVALEDLALLAGLPLDDEPRLVFGARLARCVREQGGGWVVHFQPNSGVLLTEQAVAESCLPGAAEEELRATLERQQRWLDEGVPWP